MNTRCYFIGTTLGDNPVPHQFVALAEELVSRGHRVVILAPHCRTDLENHSGNPAIYTWPSPRPTKLRDALFLQRLICKYKPSCLIANFVAVNVMMTVGWAMRVPIRVAWYHTVSEQIAQDSPQPRWKQNLLQLRKGLAYCAATRLVANSGASSADAQKVYSLPKFKCAVFHNAIRDPLCELHLPADFVPFETARLVCVGRFFPSKGQDVLLRALAILRKQVPQIHVEFIGAGPEKSSFEKLARNLGVEGHCTFSSQLPHDEVLKKMAGAVCTVVPSRHEAFGLVNIESMAMGTPVVASAVGGIVEIVRDGKDGFLVPPNDPEKLAERLLALVSNPRLRSELGCNARQRFLSHFELRSAISEQADWFESIANVSFVRRRSAVSGTAQAVSQQL